MQIMSGIELSVLIHVVHYDSCGNQYVIACYLTRALFCFVIGRLSTTCRSVHKIPRKGINVSSPQLLKLPMDGIVKVQMLSKGIMLCNWKPFKLTLIKIVL